jgi:hypothetical protein
MAREIAKRSTFRRRQEKARMSMDQQTGKGERRSSNRKAKEQKTILKPSVQQDEKDILDNLPRDSPSGTGRDIEQDQEQTQDRNDERRTG